MSVCVCALYTFIKENGSLAWRGERDERGKAYSSVRLPSLGDWVIKESALFSPRPCSAVSSLPSCTTRACMDDVQIGS